MQVYTTKDLVNLLQLLQASRQSGELFVRPLEQQNGIPWQGWFQLLDGHIVSCLLRNELNGQIMLHNNSALDWLTNPQHGKLEWMLKEGSQPATNTFLPLQPKRSSPGREEMRRLPGPRTPAQQPSNNSPVRKDQLTIIPRRTERGKITSGDFLSSREHLQIFALVDGRRSIGEIARLLHKSPDVILHVLNDLRTIDLVE